MSITRASIEHCQKHAALFSGSLWRSWLKNDNKRPVRPEQANAERSSLRDYLGGSFFDRELRLQVFDAKKAQKVSPRANIILSGHLKSFSPINNILCFCLPK